MNNVIQMKTKEYHHGKPGLVRNLLQAVHAQSKTMQKYMRLLHQEKAMTENEIKGLCWALNGVKKVNLTADERTKLHEMLERRSERAITKEQAKFGIKWLKTKAFKLNGEARKNCTLGEREQRIVKNFSHFKFAGVYNSQESFGNGHSLYKQYVPIWRTYAKDGSYFDYVVMSSGLFVTIEILS